MEGKRGLAGRQGKSKKELEAMEGLVSVERAPWCQSRWEAHAEIWAPKTKRGEA